MEASEVGPLRLLGTWQGGPFATIVFTSVVQPGTEQSPRYEYTATRSGEDVVQRGNYWIEAGVLALQRLGASDDAVDRFAIVLTMNGSAVTPHLAPDGNPDGAFELARPHNCGRCGNACRIGPHGEDPNCYQGRCTVYSSAEPGGCC